MQSSGFLSAGQRLSKDLARGFPFVLRCKVTTIFVNVQTNTPKSLVNALFTAYFWVFCYFQQAKNMFYSRFLRGQA